MTINIIAVTYGKRFHLLEKTINAVISDKRTDKVILIDNGSLNGLEIDEYIKNNSKNNIILIRNKKNEGSAGGFKKGIIEARKNVSDYVLLLDDDNVIEKNWSDYFTNILDFFPDKKVVLKGNRDDSNLHITNVPSEKEKVFRIGYLSFKKIKKIFWKKDIGIFQPVVYMPNGASSYGGTLLPFSAIEETEPPLESLYLYDDDTEYLFRVSRKGYKTYQISRPIVKDIDHTFSDNSSNLRLFDKNVSLIKLFFITRNLYVLPLITKQQTKLSIMFRGGLGIFIKLVYTFIKLGINKFTIERSEIIILAFFDGIRLKFNNEEIIKKYSSK